MDLGNIVVFVFGGRFDPVGGYFARTEELGKWKGEFKFINLVNFSFGEFSLGLI